MFVTLAIVFPALLLLGILGMERVERPLDARAPALRERDDELDFDGRPAR